MFWKKKETRELTREEKRKATLIERYGPNYAHEFGLQTAATNKERYGDKFYEDAGRKGGKISRGGGFADHDLAVRAGRIGGKASRRTKKEV